MTEKPTQGPGVRVSDAEREAVVAQLEKALADGRITVDEFRQRAEAAYSALTTAELQPLLADLPARASPEVEIVGSRAPATLFNFMGDVKLDGSAPVPSRITTGFGDIRIDLRELRSDADVIELDLSTVLGDVEVIVAESVDAELNGWTILGKRKTDLAQCRGSQAPRGSSSGRMRSWEIFACAASPPASRPAAGERCSTGSLNGRSPPRRSGPAPNLRPRDGRRDVGLCHVYRRGRQHCRVSFDVERLLHLWSDPLPVDDGAATAAFRELYADPVTVNGTSMSPAAFVARARAVQHAFAPVRRELLSVVEQGDRVAVAFRMGGPHVGSWTTSAGPLPPTGQELWLRVIERPHGVRRTDHRHHHGRGRAGRAGGLGRRPAAPARRRGDRRPSGPAPSMRACRACPLALRRGACDASTRDCSKPPLCPVRAYRSRGTLYRTTTATGPTRPALRHGILPAGTDRSSRHGREERTWPACTCRRTKRTPIDYRAFGRRDDGTLDPRGAVETGGRGDGLPHLTSQGSVVLSGGGRHLLVTNSGSGDVSLWPSATDP